MQDETAEQPTHSRRRLLKLAAAGATGAGATTLLAATPASAATSADALARSVTADATTVSAAARGTTPLTVNGGTGSGTAPTTDASALVVNAGPNAGTGLTATSATGSAVTATVTSGNGYQPALTATTASAFQPAVAAIGKVRDLLASGSGVITQRLQAAAGSPGKTAAALPGDTVLDAAGTPWVCSATYGSSRTPVWRKVAATPAESPNGGSYNLLPYPIQIFDSQPGATAPIRPGKRIPANTAYDIQVTGTAVNGVAVPPGAIGVVANIGVYADEESSFTIYASDVAQPPVALFYVDGGIFGFAQPTVRLSSAGKLRVYGSAAQEVVIDVVAFVY